MLERAASVAARLFRLGRLYRRQTLAWGLGALAMLATCSVRCRTDATEVATFNIRNFPEHEQQITHAFATIAALDVPVIAVQEITDPQRFARAAKRELGEEWTASFGPTRASEKRPLYLGVLFDADRYEQRSSRLHRVGPGRAMLEVVLDSRERDATLRVFVVHLKSGGDYADMRQEQLRAFAPIVRDAAESDDEIVVLGDFNATGDQDRRTLEAFATSTGLDWATRELACTAYWRPGGKCQGSALDHVFTTRPAHDARARAACEQHGCEPGDRCPIYYDQVSDHCPVSVAF